MKLFKQVDIAISITLVIGFTLYYSYYDTGILFTAYFIVGGWQVISMLVHSFMGWFTKKKSIRKVYHWVTFIIIAAGCFGFLINIPLFIFYIMLFAAPAMAIIYTAICVNELRQLPGRPLNEIK